MKKLLAAVMVFGATLSTGAFAHGGHGGGHGHSHGGGFGHGHGGHGHRVTCVARNLRGWTFTATGRNRYNVKQRALNKCYNSGSRVCNVVACY